MRALDIITGYVIYNPAYTYKFQLKTTIILWIVGIELSSFEKKVSDQTAATIVLDQAAV